MLARAQRAHFKAFVEGKATKPDDPYYTWWQELEQEKAGLMGILQHGYKPKGKPYTLLSYAFLHGGWLHLLGNMLFLWLCGCNMEDRWGWWRWLALYLGGGVVSALAWAATHSFHSDVPLVGASGAIAAAMGAFLVVSHSATIRMFYFWWILRPVYGTFEIKAYWALPLWFLEQLFGMLLEGPMVPVAYSAHVGGFAFGAAAALILRATGHDRELANASVAKATLFTADPLYLEALAARETGNKVQAQALFTTLLEQNPGHANGALELFRLELELGTPESALKAAEQAVANCKRERDYQAIREILAELKKHHPTLLPSDRTLAAAALAYAQESPQTAVLFYQAIYSYHPTSPLAPRSMLDAGRLLLEIPGKRRAAGDQLRHLIAAYPGTAFAEQAQTLLDAARAEEAQMAANG